MIHNETVNVWTHLLGMLVFVFLVSYTFTRYEPSDFYYQSLSANPNFKSKRFDFGVPKTTLTNYLEDASFNQSLA